MLRLRFFNERPPDAFLVEAACFLFHQEKVLLEPEGRTVARHQDSEWRIGERAFLKAECGTRVVCGFPEADQQWEEHGPFLWIRIVDGVMSGDGTPLARLEKTAGWRSLVRGRMTPLVRLRE